MSAAVLDPVIDRRFTRTACLACIAQSEVCVYLTW